MRFFETARRFLGRITGGVRRMGKFASPLLENVSKPPPVYERNLATFGNSNISNMKVCRKPLASNIKSIIEKMGGNVPYDKLFHLYLTFNAGNTPMVLEKNQVINLSTYPYAGEGTEHRNVSIPGYLTLNEMIRKTQDRMGERYFPYDAFRNNCQDFIMNVLDANGMNNSELSQFIKQDTREISASLPSIIPTIATALTNIGGNIDLRLQKYVEGLDGRPSNQADAS